jgi:hypothetical protein
VCPRAANLLSTSSSGDLVTLERCRDVSSFLSLNLNLLSACRTVRENCWAVPLNTSSFLSRCVWKRVYTTTTQQTCLSPASLRGKTRAQVGEKAWRQCVSMTDDTRQVTVREAQTNPLYSMVYRCVCVCTCVGMTGCEACLMLPSVCV